MQPEQQKIQPDYDFILNTGQKKRGLNLGTSPFNSRLLVIVGGFFILLIVFVILKSILSSSSIGVADYDTLLQNQTEIIHIMSSDLQNQNQSAVINSANQAFSQTALLTMTSYQASMIKYLAKNGVKVNASALKANVSSQIDSQFTSAQSSNNFNSIFQNVMSQQLVTYTSNLVKAYSNTKGSLGRQLLQNENKGTQLLIRELNVQYS